MLFVVNEIECSLALCGWDAASGSTSPLCLASTLPADMFATNTASAIVISSDGRSLYVSNRGHDSIAHFAFDSSAMAIRFACAPDDGRLSFSAVVAQCESPSPSVIALCDVRDVFPPSQDDAE